VACPALQYFSTLFDKDTILEIKIVELKVCVFILFTHFSAIFPILRRTERDMIKMYIGLHVKYTLLLSDFNETLIFSTNFRKIINIKFRENPSSGVELFDACRLTDAQT
jgi:hypothetical protein